MKNFKIFINFLFFICIVFLVCEITLGITGCFRYKNERNMDNLPKLPYTTRPEIQNANLNELDCDISETKNCAEFFRLPSGLQYSNKSPITLFGCSFTHGTMLLGEKQIFSYKLSEILKRPVYNRALIGANFANMLYQVTNDDFYKKVPASDTVIYIMINDHYRRMLSYKFDPVEDLFILNYKFNKSNKELRLDNYSNKFLNFIKSTYTVSFLYALWINHYILKNIDAENITDMVLTFFIKTRNELELHWKNKVKFIVIFYDDCHNDLWNSDILRQKLVDNGFYVIDIKDLIDEQLFDNDKYMKNDHPTEAVWDILTPLIIKEANL